MPSTRAATAACRLAGHAALLAAGAAACRSADPLTSVCTLIGADPQLRVVVAGVRAADTVVVAAAAVGTAPRPEGAQRDSASGACAGPGCATGVPLLAFAPDTVAITATTSGRSARRVVAPSYSILRPNGPRCPPAVRAGTVDVPAP